MATSISGKKVLKDISFSGQNFTLVTDFTRSILNDKSHLFFVFVFEKVACIYIQGKAIWRRACLLYTSPSPRDATLSRMPSSA